MTDTAITEATAREMIVAMNNLRDEMRHLRSPDIRHREEFRVDVEKFYTRLCVQTVEESAAMILVEPLGRSVEFWRALEEKLVQNHWRILKTESGWMLMNPVLCTPPPPRT